MSLVKIAILLARVLSTLGQITAKMLTMVVYHFWGHFALMLSGIDNDFTKLSLKKYKQILSTNFKLPKAAASSGLGMDIRNLIIRISGHTDLIIQKPDNFAPYNESIRF